MITQSLNAAPDAGRGHFLTGTELERSELLALIEEAENLRVARRTSRSLPILAGRTLAMLFEKPSLRTRVSFTLAMQELGGNVIELNASSLKKEEPEDTVRVLEGYCDAIMVRTHGHVALERMARVARIPVINGLSDLHHPCQALADLLTLKQNFGVLKGLKLAYIGDGNNVLNSLLLLAPMLGIEVAYSCPKGFSPNPLILQLAQERARAAGGGITFYSDPRSAATDAHALYTDVWTSMGFEAEGQEREEAFQGFQINAELYARAETGAIIMHCLPMVRGKEITSEMADHSHSRLFQQSENRLHAQKALLARLFHVHASARHELMTEQMSEPSMKEQDSWRPANHKHV